MLVEGQWKKVVMAMQFTVVVSDEGSCSDTEKTPNIAYFTVEEYIYVTEKVPNIAYFTVEDESSCSGEKTYSIIFTKEDALGGDVVPCSQFTSLTMPGVFPQYRKISAISPIVDSRQGEDRVSVAKLYFHITKDGILNPLGMKVARDSNEDLIPEVEDISESIPGRHGEISFGSRYAPRIINLHVAVEYPYSDRGKVKKILARQLQPATLEAKPLAFAENIERMYMVKSIGSIVPNQHLTWLDFTISFKANDPLAYNSFENIHIGSGTLYNDGDFETPLIIEVRGIITDPVVTVGNKTMKYTGTLSSVDVLRIDTGKMTVTFNNYNAMDRFEGDFPMLQVGETEVVANDKVTFRWRDRWL